MEKQKVTYSFDEVQQITSSTQKKLTAIAHLPKFKPLTLILLLFLGLGYGNMAVAQVLLDFNNTSDLTSKFNPDATPACDSGICGGFGGDHGVGISGVTQIFRINVRALVLGCAFVGVALLEMRHTLSFREPLQNPAAGMAGVSVCWHSLII